MSKSTLMYLFFTLLLFAIQGFSGDFDITVPCYSVHLSNVSPTDITILESNDILIEWASGNKAMVHVNAEEEALLHHLGYFPVRVPRTEPLVAYPSIQDIYDSMDEVITANPDICRLITYGTSVEGRPLKAIIVSDNPDTEELEPEIRITGGIHGDEPAATTTTLNFLVVLTDGYATSPTCQYVINNSELWIIPVVNPDGYYHDNRSNANGIDLNRNCSYMGPGGGGGSTAFSEPETAGLRDFTMQNWPAVENFINPFVTGLSLHGGAACFNSVWNYTESPLPEDYDFILSQGNSYATNPGIVAYFGSNFDIYVPGASWYETNGDVNDWSYGECGTVDHTIEVHYDKHVSDWPGVANAHYGAMLSFCQSSVYGIWGTVKNGSGDPLDAHISIGTSDSFDSTPLRFCRTDVILGDYHKSLVPGTYDVQVTVDGYTPQSVNGVVVGAEEQVEVSFTLDPVGIEDTTEQGIAVGRLSVFPNPLASICEFTLPLSGVEGTLVIYDISGHAIEQLNVGSDDVSLQWNCTDTQGSVVPSGIYIARYSGGGIVETTRLIVNR